jgi:small Trp-rich protein
MAFLVVGIALLLLKYLEIGPFAEMGWLWVLAPFGLASLWWTWADYSGFTKRKAMEKMARKRKLRAQKQREALGLGVGKKR